jgi:hypothetical protein
MRPTQETPFEVIPAKVFPPVLLLDSRCRLTRPVEDLLLTLLEFLPVLELLEPDLMPVPPDLVSKLVVHPQYLLVVSTQEERGQNSPGTSSLGIHSTLSPTGV